MAVAAIIAGLSAAVPGQVFAKGMSPLLLGSNWGEAEYSLLVGGFDAKRIVDIFFAPIHTGGLVLERLEGSCPELEDDTPASTSLLPPGTALTFYSLEGDVLGHGTSGGMGFTCYDASGQAFLTPELSNIRDVSGGYSGAFIGVRKGAAYAGTRTKRSEQGGSIVFRPEKGDVAIELRPRSTDEYGEIYVGILRPGPGEREIFMEQPVDVEDITAAFIDLNNDGILEFLLITEGAAGSIGVYSTAPSPERNPLLLIDTGE